MTLFTPLGIMCFQSVRMMYIPASQPVHLSHNCVILLIAKKKIETQNRFETSGHTTIFKVFSSIYFLNERKAGTF